MYNFKANLDADLSIFLIEFHGIDQRMEESLLQHLPIRKVEHLLVTLKLIVIVVSVDEVSETDVDVVVVHLGLEWCYDLLNYLHDLSACLPRALDQAIVIHEQLPTDH